MNKVWTVDELRLLPLNEINEILPDDVDEQIDNLPSTVTSIVRESGKVVKNYTDRKGIIKLLNGDLLLIDETIVSLDAI